MRDLRRKLPTFEQKKCKKKKKEGKIDFNVYKEVCQIIK